MSVASAIPMVLEWSPDLDRGAWGDPVLTDCEEVATSGLSDLAPYHHDFGRGIRLARGESTGTYRTFVRTIGALSSWGPAEAVIAKYPAGVSLRLWDGTVERYWNGSAWVAPTLSVHWNTAAEIYAALPSYTGAALGFTVQLTRVGTETPVVLGIRAVCRVMFASTSGDTSRASSWMDDLLHRILVRRAYQEVALQGSQEFVVTASTASVVDLSKGVGPYPFDVTGVEGVYDVTDDARLRTPLAGTWSSSTKKWTATAPMTVGHTIHVRFTFRPWIEHTSDMDAFFDQLPALVFEGVTVLRENRGWGGIAVMNPDGETAIDVDAPAFSDLSIAGRILAARTTDRDRIYDEVSRWLSDGVEEVSPSTSMVASLELVPGDIPATLGGHAERRFTIRVTGWVEWPGRERVAHVLETGGWSPEISGGSQ